MFMCASGGEVMGAGIPCRMSCRPGERRDPYAAAPPTSTEARRLSDNQHRWLWVPAFAGTTATDLPDRLFCTVVQFFLSSPLCKNISLRASGKSNLELSPSDPSEGRIAIVTDAGLDAMDVAASAHSCGRMAPAADGEVVWTIFWFSVKHAEAKKTL
jgi:hypothetical protein